MVSNLEQTYAEPVPEGPPDTGDHPKIALAIAAHPDDADFGCAGTAYLWSKEGWEFYYLVCTDGSKGTEDPSLTADRLVPMRRKEQRAAAETLGVKDVLFLDGYVDGELARTRELLGDVVRVIREVKPYAVFTHDPTQIIIRNSFINHSDHRAAGLTAVDAVYPAARDRWNFPEQLDEGLEPHKVKELFIWGSEQPTFTVDITDVVDTKIQALLCHHSQFGEGTEFLQRVRDRWKGEDGRYAERFRRVAYGTRRRVCTECGYVHFDDPKVAVGILAERRGRLLLVRRNHEPHAGEWSFPSGYVDVGEVLEEAAVREAKEETGFDVRIDRLLGAYSTRGERVIFLAYAARIAGGRLEAGAECADVRFFPSDALPPLGFPHDQEILRAWRGHQGPHLPPS